MDYATKKPPKRKKTDNVIEVMLGSEPGTLEIDDHEVHENGIRQTIVWQLDKTLEAGNFTSFEWLDLPATAGTFDSPDISPDGNSLRIGDHNGKTAPKNIRHAYIVTVEFGGVVYTSRTHSPAATIRDPIIINR